jgi:hypothetical protein
MLSATTLATWIRGEYQSMPGLKLTREQACRLWSVHDNDTCDAALQALIDEGFLHRTGTGKYVCLPRPLGKTARPINAGVREQQLRCPYCRKLTVVPAREGARAQSTATLRCEGCRRIVTFTAISA